MSFDIIKMASAALAAMLALSHPVMAQETAPKPPAAPEQEGTQPPAEAETTPGVDDAQGTGIEPPVAGSAGPGYGNSAEPEAAPAQPPVQGN